MWPFWAVLTTYQDQHFRTFFFFGQFANMNQQIGKEPIISVKSSHKQLLLKGILLPNPSKQIRATQNPRRAVALIHPKLESGNCQISPQLSDHLTSLKYNPVVLQNPRKSKNMRKSNFEQASNTSGVFFWKKTSNSIRQTFTPFLPCCRCAKHLEHVTDQRSTLGPPKGLWIPTGKSSSSMDLFGFLILRHTHIKKLRQHSTSKKSSTYFIFASFFVCKGICSSYTPKS